MGNKLLDRLAWRAGRWYLRRRFPGARRKLAIAGVTGLVVVGAGVAVVARRRPPGG